MRRTLVRCILTTAPNVFFIATIGGCSGSPDNSASARLPVVAVQPPPGTSWSATVTDTPEGGVRMGNPAAAVRLVEYGSLTCPHCAAFASASIDPLRRHYVETGKVSYEFRIFVRDPVDVTAALLARCNGAQAFFPLVDQLYGSQADWSARAAQLPSSVSQQLSALLPTQQVNRYADITGLRDFVRQRGIPAAQANSCLNDPKAAVRLLTVQQEATDKYQIQATPTFLLNGQLLPDVATWDAVKAQLDAAGA